MFTQYGLRRDLLNAINIRSLFPIFGFEPLPCQESINADVVRFTDRALSSVRDQLFDHEMGAVGYYLDQEVRFDTKACYLGRPSNEIVRKIARLPTVDTNAPTKLSPEQKVKFDNHPRVIRLTQKNKDLTKRLKKGL